MYEEICASRADYERAFGRSWLKDAREFEEHLLRRKRWRRRWHVHGYCSACHAVRDLRVTRRGGTKRKDGVWIPLWREHLTCQTCHFNSRQRYMAGLLLDAITLRPEPRVYMTEQVTRFFEWANTLTEIGELLGGEYLPDPESRRGLPSDVIHQDLEALSHETSSIDILVSNDVLEHVSDPEQGIREIARVLRPGGVALIGIPIQPNCDESVSRARYIRGSLEHLLEPVYHGNPLDPKGGSLVFTDFGWDIVDRFRAAGFAHFDAQLYWSSLHGYLGGPYPVLRGVR